MKALQDDDYPEVIAEAYKGLVVLDPEGVEFVSHFLTRHGPRNALLAALALSESGRAELVQPLIDAWREWRDRSDGMNENLLVAIAGLRYDDSFEFLLDTVRNGDVTYAEPALYALRIYNDDPEASRRVREAAKESGVEALIRLASRMFRER